MKYVGGKARIAKHILPIMLAERKPNQWWVEPFVGGANIIEKVSGNRIGNDNHEYLIALLKAIQTGWEPPEIITKEQYYNIKQNQNSCSKELVGFVGFLCSFGCKWWGGYASNKKGDNFAKSGKKVLLKMAKNIKGVYFICQDYRKLKIPKNSLIYCDPPYFHTTGYGRAFNHNIFWDWCRKKASENHTIFVSEYIAPSDFKCIKEINNKNILNNSNSKDITEKLFTLK